MIPDPALIAEINTRWRATIGPKIEDISLSTKPFGNPQRGPALEAHKFFIPSLAEMRAAKSINHRKVDAAVKAYLQKGGEIRQLTPNGEVKGGQSARADDRLKPWR